MDLKLADVFEPELLVVLDEICHHFLGLLQVQINDLDSVFLHKLPGSYGFPPDRRSSSTLYWVPFLRPFIASLADYLAIPDQNRNPALGQTLFSFLHEFVHII